MSAHEVARKDHGASADRILECLALARSHVTDLYQTNDPGQKTEAYAVSMMALVEAETDLENMESVARDMVAPSLDERTEVQR